MQIVGEFELPGQVLPEQRGTGLLGDKATVSVMHINIILYILVYQDNILRYIIFYVVLFHYLVLILPEPLKNLHNCCLIVFIFFSVLA